MEAEESGMKLYTTLLTIRCTPSEIGKARLVAKSFGLSVSEWIRHIISTSKIKGEK